MPAPQPDSLVPHGRTLHDILMALLHLAIMKKIFRTCLRFVLPMVTTGSAIALGLGNASGPVIIGQPVRIEISLIGSDAGVPSIECFNLRAPQSEIAGSYVLHNAQLQLLTESGQASLVVTSSAPVQEPVLEFALAVGCGFALSKDYLLLSDEPGRVASASLPTVQPTAALAPSSNLSPAPAKPQASSPPVDRAADAMLRLTSTLSLATLARQKYPLQPKAREKFIRMMLLANPGVTSGDSLIESGIELKVPPGLPIRRLGAPTSRVKPPPADPALLTRPAVPLRSPAGDDATPPASKPRKDVLVLGAAVERNRNPAELLAEAERLAAILLDQSKAQDALMEKTGKLDDTLKEFKTHFIGMTDRLNKIEAERQAEKLAPKPPSLDFLELLVAVLAGGLMGALGLFFFNRRQAQRGTGSAPRPTSALPASPLAAAPTPQRKVLDDIDLPWANRASTPSLGNPRNGTGNNVAVATPGEPENAEETPQHDFDFSRPSPPSAPGEGHSLDQISKKVSP